MGVQPGDSSGWWGKRIDLAKEIAGDAYRTARRQVSKQLD
jgi:hypothetical protein